MKWTGIEKPQDCSKITEVDISNNNLTKIPNWINECNNLLTLQCNNNQITQIPDTLPDSLQIFDCRCNKITQIPYTLPNSLQEFYCSHNQITQIPLSIINLQKLEYISCYDSPLKLPMIIYYLPIVDYFFNNKRNKNIKKYCYDLMWKVQMEF
jgi:Leucine-rich repeat (LRR) protein